VKRWFILGDVSILLSGNNRGQGTTEYLLLFGAVIVLAIAALLIYNAYFDGTSLTAADDLNKMRNDSNSSKTVVIAVVNVGPPVWSKLNYYVTDPAGNQIKSGQIATTNTIGQASLSLGKLPVGSSIRFHETFNGNNNPPNTDVNAKAVITVTADGKNIFNWNVDKLVRWNVYEGVNPDPTVKIS
jgi:hypothetical protein